MPRTLSEGLASETITSDFWEGSPKRAVCFAGNIYFLNSRTGLFAFWSVVLARLSVCRAELAS